VARAIVANRDHAQRRLLETANTAAGDHLRRGFLVVVEKTSSSRGFDVGDHGWS
jgi:hypothetical protein